MAATVLDPTVSGISTAAVCVRDGGVVVAPSDTNMALTVDPRDEDAIERVYEIKGRPRHKPLTLFVRDLDDWRQFAHHDDPSVVDALVENFWPGPLNLVLEQVDDTLDEHLSLDGTVSIGCLSNPVWRDFVAHVGRPVAMTSANQSGTVDDGTLVDVETAIDHVGNDVDYVLTGEPTGTTRASTIISLADGGRTDATLLRRGDLSPTDLENRTPVAVE